MGDLVDQGLLRPRNLVWAIENAYSPEVRSAALTLLANWLGKSTTFQTALRYGPEVIKGTPYLRQKEDESLFKALEYLVIALVAVTVLGSVLLTWIASRISQGQSWDLMLISGVLSLLLIAIIAAPFIRLMKRRFDAEMTNFRNYRAGQEGEEWVEQLVRARLDSRWKVFRNVMIPGAGGDIDFVLVGTSGVWVLEVKAFKIEVRAIGDSWEWKEGKSWKPLDGNPTRQVASNAAALHDFLEDESKVAVWVNAAVVLTQQQQEANFVRGKDDPKVPSIWLHDEVEDHLYELNSLDALLLEAEREKIVNALRGTLSKPEA